jgi:type IV secretory pathway TraG/TraD family ATPase VirD4
MDNSKKNNENEFDCSGIHGSAKYDPTNEEVQKGSPVSKKHIKPFKFKVDKSFSHTFVLGPTGSGKGVAIAQIGKFKVPKSLTWKGSTMVFDILTEEIAKNSSPSDFTIQDII